MSQQAGRDWQANNENLAKYPDPKLLHNVIQLAVRMGKTHYL